MDDKISIRGLNKADVLAALYNASKPQGYGLPHYTPEDMDREEAEELLLQGASFDYLRGRVMKVRLSSDVFSPLSYDRDNGEGAAERCIETLRNKHADAETAA